MPITRINHFEAKPGAEQALCEFLQSVIAIIENCSGCLGCQLLLSLDNSANIAIVEQWVDVESHQRAAGAIPPEQLQAAFEFFAKPPSGSYYTSVN